MSERDAKTASDRGSGQQSGDRDVASGLSPGRGPIEQALLNCKVRRRLSARKQDAAANAPPSALVDPTPAPMLDAADVSKTSRARGQRASAPVATMGAEPADAGDGLAGELVAGGVTFSEERRAAEDPATPVREAGKAVSEGVEHGLEDAPFVEERGEAGELGLRGVAQIARMPYVIHLVREKQYEEALRYISETLQFSDAVEVIKVVMEHNGLELSDLTVVAELALKFPKVAKIARFAVAGLQAADVLLVGVEFQMEAIRALGEAKEAGERDNLIYLYSSAWANGFLWGSYTNDGAVTKEQRDAVANGLREGKATAGHLGERAAEVGRKLLQKYGDPKNVERALIDVLLKRAGIEGVRLHRGGEGGR